MEIYVAWKLENMYNKHTVSIYSKYIREYSKYTVCKKYCRPLTQTLLKRDITHQ